VIPARAEHRKRKIIDVKMWNGSLSLLRTDEIAVGKVINILKTHLVTLLSCFNQITWRIQRENHNLSNDAEIFAADRIRHSGITVTNFQT
jgi:hypothetical protein